MHTCICHMRCLTSAFKSVPQIRLYKRAGMANAAVELQDGIRQQLDEVAKEREEKDTKLLKQKTMGMEMRHRARLSKMEATQNAEMKALRNAQEADFAALVHSQAAELHELQEAVTGMIKFGTEWVPHEKASKPWVAQLKKNRFRATWQLSELQSHVEKLIDGGTVTSKVIELQRQADELLKKETVRWHDKLMHAALGEHSSSVLSQLIASQKIAQSKMQDHHTARLRLAEKQAASAQKMLAGQFRLEKLQLVEKFKQNHRKVELRGNDELNLSGRHRRGSVTGSSPSGLGVVW